MLSTIQTEMDRNEFEILQVKERLRICPEDEEIFIKHELKQLQEQKRQLVRQLKTVR